MSVVAVVALMATTEFFPRSAPPLLCVTLRASRRSAATQAGRSHSGRRLLCTSWQIRHPCAAERPGAPALFERDRSWPPASGARDCSEWGGPDPDARFVGSPGRVHLAEAGHERPRRLYQSGSCTRRCEVVGAEVRVVSRRKHFRDQTHDVLPRGRPAADRTTGAGPPRRPLPPRRPALRERRSGLPI